MKIFVINGPNLNMLGVREPEKYGTKTLIDVEDEVREYLESNNAECIFLQSNYEGELVDMIQFAYFEGGDGIVINPAAYTHTSVALLDALLAASLPTVEIHITDPDAREEFRRTNYVRGACFATVKGLGTDGYIEACRILLEALYEGKNKPV